jgi:hypothetical protein
VNFLLWGSAVIAKDTRDGLGDLFRKTKGDTPAALPKRTIAIRELMRTSVANAAPDSRRWRLIPVTNRTYKLNEIVNVLIDFRNAIGIPRRNVRFILTIPGGYGPFDGQHNRTSLMT